MEKKKTLKSSLVKCVGCGGGLVFSPKKQGLKCSKCGRIHSFAKNKKHSKHNIADKPTSFEGYKKWSQENKVLKCKTCGAEVILNRLEYSGICAYCGSSYVSETKSLPGFVPDAIIPFKFDEIGAGERFREKVKRKFFVPRAFKKQIPANKIRGIYIPTFSFDANSSTEYSGILSRDEVSQANSNHPLSVNAYDFNISGIKQVSLKDVLIETSSQINQKQMSKILPYNMSEAYKFDENFIRGYVVEHFETAFEECYKQALENMKQRIKQEILEGYNYNKIVSFYMVPIFSEEKFDYKLVPIYQFEYQYKNKPYRTYMNGQTGKIGDGLPISPWKVCLVILMVLGFVAGVTLLSFLTVA